MAYTGKTPVSHTDVTQSQSMTVTETLTANDVVTPSINGGQVGGRRNILYNGAMQIAQRGTSSAGVTGAGYQTLDRFRFTVGSAGVGTYTISQDTDAPSGFGYSYKIDCTTADASPDATDAVFVATRLEGQDLQLLKKGTANALPVTLSFWVKSNLTGTYQANLYDLDNSRLLGATYAISSADTWEYKTITFAGDASGAFTNDNNLSLQIEWALDGGTDYTSGAVPTSWETATNADRAAGLTVNLADNTANYWQITGIQLEVGSVATEFEHRSYGEELALCQRYCVVYTNDVDGAETFVTLGIGYSSGSTAVRWTPNVPVPLRAEASISQTGSLQFFNFGVTLSSPAANRDGCSLTPAYSFTSSSALTNGVAGVVRGNSDATAKITLDAEL